ncbi:Fe-S cluster assembly protein SufD [Synechococcus sp. Tobar12-5m-g]|uniref:Fe-S cluster assembly protein SufD n=1 Tax=unclassified Synechococcus TaxID=2626047 RepID=UPI0020CD0074|nr:MULTISPECIES: Fe-S cluster assembly protein SufD [unclassified Synechococcus]MCP9772666.1 Fe-S cluster assembly protein SufD [Synechococcus sp. Tobar12-5m-g]MCP9873478.1 Fe-S cluster assembly protein SufD [Synechococcus sp. Cruz CV-v-12]
MVVSSTRSPLAEASPWADRLLERLPSPAGALAAVQGRGREALARQSLPNRRQEDWRFTDLAPLTALDPAALALVADGQGLAQLADCPAPAAGTVRLWLDGLSDPLAGQFLPAGLSRLTPEQLDQDLGHSLACCGSEQHWPVEFNQATARHCLALRVSGCVAETLELVAVADQQHTLLPVRVLLVLEENANLKVLQVQLGSGSSLSSLVVEAQLGQGAELLHGLLALGEGGACFLGHLAVEQASGSRFRSVAASRGWALFRFEPRISQVDGAAQTELLGLQLVEGPQVADTHSQVRFLGPDGALEQVHKAIADGRGRSVFDGAVSVPRLAQRTNANQISRNLLLSDQARIDTKPQLEIVADEVRCTHGATVSRLQADQLFYLQSRGIDAATAARLLKRGFCQEVLGKLPAAAAVWQPLQRLLAEA